MTWTRLPGSVLTPLMALTVAATLAACAPGPPLMVARSPFEVKAELPAGLELRYRAADRIAIQSRLAGTRETGFTGYATVTQRDPNSFRITYAMTQLELGDLDRNSFSLRSGTPVRLDDVATTTIETDASGRFITIEPAVPRFLGEAVATTRPGRPVALSRDWMDLFESLELLPLYRPDLAIGSTIAPTTLSELLEKRIEMLDAMVRGNTSGGWPDLPRGGMLTPEQRELFISAIRTRTLPVVYSGDVRIRGTTRFGGATYVYASGRVRRTLRDGRIFDRRVEYLIDPDSGVIVVNRIAQAPPPVIRP